MLCHSITSYSLFKAVFCSSEKKYVWWSSSKSQKLWVDDKRTFRDKVLKNLKKQALMSPALSKGWFSDTSSFSSFTSEANVFHFLLHIQISLFFKVQIKPKLSQDSIWLPHINIYVLWPPVKDLGSCNIYDLHSVNVEDIYGEELKN